MRILGIDYGETRVGLAVTDELQITAQGLETVKHQGNDRILLKRLDEIMEKFEIKTIVVGMPLLMNGDKSTRANVTEKFIHKLKCKYNKIEIVSVDESFFITSGLIILVSTLNKILSSNVLTIGNNNSIKSLRTFILSSLP